MKYDFGTQKLTLMEVCGTHTMSIARAGIRSILPNNIHLISGPGCPVCVSSTQDIARSIELARKKNVIVASFGDMLKVPCGDDRLQNYNSVKIIYNPLEALSLAEKNKTHEVVLLGVGFETTAPLIATTIVRAHEKNIKNFSVLPMNKLVPPALKAIIADPDFAINAFILPGHVSAITGSDYFNFLSETDICSVIAGFKPKQILDAISTIVKNHQEKNYKVINSYTNIVSKEGNLKALEYMNRVFEPIDTDWRGIGKIPQSGLGIRSLYSTWNALCKFDFSSDDIQDPPNCLCGKILLGKANPYDCKHFAKSCTPAHPVGPCMVSSEGTCAAKYKYEYVPEEIK